MKFNILTMLLLWTSLYAEISIQRDKDIRYALQGKAYITKQEKKNITHIKLKKYFLATIHNKAFFFSSDEKVYNLYMTAFLEKARPLWLEDDIFVFHTSSSKHYLKRLKKHYEKKYHLHLTLYKNKHFWKNTFKLRTVDREDLQQYIDDKIARYNNLKIKKMQKNKKNAKKALILARITKKREIHYIKKGKAYIKRQEKKQLSYIKLKKYYLATIQDKAFFFGSDEKAYNLYMTAFLEKARPLWLEDDIFVFHTSSSKRYLKRLKKHYEKKYHLHLTLYKNKHFWKNTFKLRTVDREDLNAYLDNAILNYIGPKKRVKKTKSTTISIAKVKSKREAKLVQKASRYLKKHTQDSKTKLDRYILYKEVEYPSIFSSNIPIYNLYLTSILQKGTPIWLADNRFIFHTSHSKKYLKTLQRRYKRKYHLDLTVSKNTSYKKKFWTLMSVDNEDIIAYLQSQIPTKYKRKQKKITLKRIKKDLIQASILRNRDVYYAQIGRAYIRTQTKKHLTDIKLKKYFLATTRTKPFIFTSDEVVYNLYLTAFLEKARPVWLENDQFVFHTSASKHYLKKLKKRYENKYHLPLTIYRNNYFWKSIFNFRDINTEELIAYINHKISEYFIIKEKKWLH